MVIPTLIGYFPKRTAKRPEGFKPVQVEEIGSVSTCISHGPEDWITAWRHNAMWVFDTPELAWSVVPETERACFELYAYYLFPVEFDGETQRAFPIPALQIADLPPLFERLGYDVVSRSIGNTFECSPLSCNGLAETIPTNRFCLLDDADAAFALAATCDARHCEPGPYFVIKVWRERRAG